MEILKSGKENRLVSATFDKIMQSLYVPFNRIEFSLSDRDSVRIDDNCAIISIDASNAFVEENDEKAVKIMILRGILKAVLKKNGELPEIMEDIIVNRKIIQRGLGEELFYFYYILLTQKRFDAFTANVPWLSFACHDNYNSQFLRQFAKDDAKMKTLFETLKKDLTNRRNLDAALKEYNRMVRRTDEGHL